MIQSTFQIPVPSTIDPIEDELASQTSGNPLRCNMCGGSVGIALRKVEKDYIPFAAYLTLFVGLLIGLLIILALRVQHKIQLPFCETCWKTSQRADLLAGLGIGAFVVSLIAGVVAILKLNSALAFLIPALPAAAFLVWALFNKRKYNARFKKITKKEVVVSTASGDMVFIKQPPQFWSGPSDLNR